MSGQTGIEIQIGLTPGQKVIGKVLHTLHLDVVGKAVAGMSTAVIHVDGQRIVEPLYEAHFVACPPGDHEVEMFMRGNGPASEKVANSIYGASSKATVDAGTVAIRLYTPQDGMGATLTRAGTRPA